MYAEAQRQCRHFTQKQMEWLYLVRDHVATSLNIEPDDLELNPFDRKGGLGRFYEVFGESYEDFNGNEY